MYELFFAFIMGFIFGAIGIAVITYFAIKKFEDE